MNVHTLDPLVDDRWDDFVATHPQATAFHQRGWLWALSRTYGYVPIVLTSAGSGEALRDGMVLCRVSSWLTGTRLVSLPFTDHCDPLQSETGDPFPFVSWLRNECDLQGLKYVEIRPLTLFQSGAAGLQPNQRYRFHELDLRNNLEDIFRGLHKDSIQRKIRRAEREGITCETGRSSQLLDEFYRLVLITRRRHNLLPQPRAWFRNLVDCMGDNVEIRIARTKDNTAIAAMLTLRHGCSVIYKYGCSDHRCHNLGGMPFLFWRLIEQSKAEGVGKIDFGRSDLDNKGLIAFKDKFGTASRLLTYYRYPRAEKKRFTMSRSARTAREILFLLPDVVRSQASRLLYRHVG